MTRRLYTLNYSELTGWRRIGFFVLSTIGLVGYVALSLFFLVLVIVPCLLFYLMGGMMSNVPGHLQTMHTNPVCRFLSFFYPVWRRFAAFIGLGADTEPTEVPCAVIKSFRNRAYPNNVCFFLSVPTMIYGASFLINKCWWGFNCPG